MFPSSGLDPEIVNEASGNGSSDPPMDELPSDGEESNFFVGASGSPSITSRLSLPKFAAAVAKFDQFKRDVVRSMGFGGMLETKTWQKLNLKLSAWLMDRVDTENSALIIEGQPQIDLFDQDVESIFNLPCGKRTIGNGAVDPSAACIEYTKVAAKLSDKGVHSLKVAEHFLELPISEESPQLEIDCFKIAFAIFSTGHVLAPSAKHDYISIDFWAALNDPSKLPEWNWCGFVIKNIHLAVRKFKADLSRHNQTIHLVGNHLFLQIRFFDKLDLGSLAPPAGVTPRAALFEYDRMKKIVELISVNGGADITFTGANVIDKHSSHVVGHKSGHDASVPLPRSNAVASRSSAPITTTFRVNNGRNGAMDFSNYLRTRYPNVAGEKLGILFKEHNARTLANMSEARVNQQGSIYNFVDKIMSYIADNCTCCKVHGKSQCILVSGVADTAGTVAQTPCCTPNYTTPAVNNSAESSAAPGRRMVMKGTPGSVRTTSLSGKKRISVDQPQFEECIEDGPAGSSHLGSTVKQATPLSMKITSYMDDVASSVVTYYVEVGKSDCFVTFGCTASSAHPPLAEIATGAWARDPWSVGSCPPGHPSTVTAAIQDWLARADEVTLGRIWVLHGKPRLLALHGKDIVNEIIHPTRMSHEMFAVINRRLGQLDAVNNKDARRMRWRKFMDPEFATVVLSDADPMEMFSIQRQFTEDSAAFDVGACRMWHLPAVFEDGWVVYSLDMLRRRIHVLDPSVGPFGFSTARVQMHEYVSSKLHGAFFHCVRSCYKSWSCEPNGWKRCFPIIMAEKFDSAESGMCATFLAKHFDGDKLVIPITQESLKLHRQSTLYDVLKLEGNEELIASATLDGIKDSFLSI